MSGIRRNLRKGCTGPGLARRAMRCQTYWARMLLAMGFGVGLPIQAQERPPLDLTEMKLEDLLNIKVTSVSKREESLSRTAAAAFVITQEDIRRSGATNIPDVLRMAPGVDVEQID